MWKNPRPFQPDQHLKVAKQKSKLTSNNNTVEKVTVAVVYPWIRGGQLCWL